MKINIPKSVHLGHAIPELCEPQWPKSKWEYEAAKNRMTKYFEHSKTEIKPDSLTEFLKKM